MSPLEGSIWVGPLYLDASALVKLFVQEAESDSLNQALLGASGVILFGFGIDLNGFGARKAHARGHTQEATSQPPLS